MHSPPCNGCDCDGHCLLMWTQAYQWDDDKTVVSWLESQLEGRNGSSLLLDNIRCLHKDHVLADVKQ